jgi:site-specific DNA recombinase
VADEQKSVTRQIDHARQYADRKGWTVDESSVFVDDGISGAEFANRPGFLRLMNALKPRAPFQVLVMSEESRLGREAIETAYALKQLVQAGVRVFFYLEDRERTLDSPTDKIMLSLTAFADELEREKARQRTYDAMIRKAKAGHVTGGRVFGYDNLEVLGPDGRRTHVERRINEREAAIVRRIFELSANGRGLTTIAKALNAEGSPAPRSQQGRPAAWAPSVGARGAVSNAVLRRDQLEPDPEAQRVGTGCGTGSAAERLVYRTGSSTPDRGRRSGAPRAGTIADGASHVPPRNEG